MSRADSWSYFNPVRISFGPGKLAEVAGLAADPVLIITTAGATKRGLTDRVCHLLQERKVHVYDSVQANPDFTDLEAALEEWRKHKIRGLIALGGGSVMDFAKAMTVGLAEPGLNLRESISAGRDLASIDPLPLIAIPTTSGTGSEVTPFATLWDFKLKKKFSLTTTRLYATHALLDPELTTTLPWDATLAPGLDALSQCYEAIWNRGATGVTTALATRGISLVPGALRTLRKTPSDLGARAAMQEASLLSGLAISRTRTALAHSMSYPITAHFGMPHGLACSFTLPALLEFNQGADDGRLGKLARELGFSPEAHVRSLQELFRDLEVAAAVKSYVPDYSRLYDLVPEMYTPGRADNNLRAADLNAVKEILTVSRVHLFGRSA